MTGKVKYNKAYRAARKVKLHRKYMHAGLLGSWRTRELKESENALRLYTKAAMDNIAKLLEVKS